MQRELRLWHYTHDQRIQQIVESGYLKLSTKFIAKGEKPAVWLSSNPEFEMTASRMTANGEILPYNQKGGPAAIRIEVKPNPKCVTWAKYKHVGGISQEMAQALERKGKQQGANPEQWYASLRVIPAKLWINIELFDKGEIEKVEYMKIFTTFFKIIEGLFLNTFHIYFFFYTVFNDLYFT